MVSCKEPYERNDLVALRKCSDRALNEANHGDAYQAMIWRSELLLAPGDGRPPTRIELDEAAFAAKRAKRIQPREPEPQLLLCQVAEQRHDNDGLAKCADELATLAPTQPEAYRFKTLVALARDDLRAAQDALDDAMDRGLEAAEASALQAQIDTRGPLWGDRRVHWIAAVLAAVTLVWLFRHRIVGRRARRN